MYNLIRTFKTTKAPEKYPYHAVLKEILESKPSAEPCSLEDSYYEEMDTNLIENKNWDPAETSHMLNLLKKNHQKFKKDSKKAFYQFLAYKLSQDGYQLRSVENIARKMVNLHRSYRSSISKKKVKHANKFLFLDDMKEIQLLFNKSEFSDQELSDDSDDGADELIKQSKLEIKMESKVKRIWTEDETAAFIKILKEQTSCLPNKWQLVSQKLGQHKFYRTPGETCRKFCNLKRTFKLCLKKFEETHEKPLKFPFFDDVKVLIESELIEVEYLKGDPDFSNAVSKEEIITVQETEIEKLCCKFCLRNSGMIRLIDPVDDSDMLQKVHYLFDEQVFFPNLCLIIILI